MVETWQPRGFLEGDEARLGEAVKFLTQNQREDLTAWWLSVPEHANTPNWDIVCTCRIDGQTGLVLVEAKAHAAELHSEGKSPGHVENDERIQLAISEANDALGGTAEGWGLCVENCYQLCNCFAWAWKVASLGVPVILVYLGFLDAGEMGAGEFRTLDAWRSCVLAHAEGVVLQSAWDRRLPARDSWFVPIIRAARISPLVVEAGVA